MDAPLFAAVAVRATDGVCVYGTFPARGDAEVAAQWLTDTATYARPIALHPPEVDPLTTRATAEMTGEVIELPARLTDLLAVHDQDPDTAGEVVVSLLLDPPSRRLVLFVGPFATTTDAWAWIAEAAGAARSQTYQARLRIHPLHRTDTVPTFSAAPEPGTEPGAQPGASEEVA